MARGYNNCLIDNRVTAMNRDLKRFAVEEIEKEVVVDGVVIVAKVKVYKKIETASNSPRAARMLGTWRGRTLSL